MGRKFIITEEEKKKIRILYEQLDVIKDTFLLANKNPFKDPKLENSVRSFSTNLKNGEKFIKWSDKARPKIEENLVKILEGKTLRHETNYSNDIYTITNISVGLIQNFSLLKKGMKPFSWIQLYFKEHHSKDKGSFFVYFHDELIDKNKEIWQKNVFDFVERSFPDIEELSDDLFNIFEVKKISTDFNP